eukprot:gene2689-2989_t
MLLRRFTRIPHLRRVELTDTQSSFYHNKLYRIHGSRRRYATWGGRPTSVIICSQHARELISAEICFWLVRLLGQDSEVLLEWPEMQAALRKIPALVAGNYPRTISPQQLNTWTRQLLAKMVVEVVPVVNQEGRDYIARTFDYSQRKTVSTQVDLNRNWLVFRATDNSSFNELEPDGQEWHGASALSGLWAMGTPYAGTFEFSDIPKTSLDAWQVMMADMQGFFKNKKNPVGIAAALIALLGYAAQGSAADTAYVELGFPFSMVVETYGPSHRGIGWTCPILRTLQLACNNANLCGETVCKDGYGYLVEPAPGMHSEANIAAEVAAASNAALAATTTAAVSTKLNILADPYLKGLNASNTAFYMEFFNPVTAAAYRDTVAKWLAAILVALDYAAKHS